MIPKSTRLKVGALALLAVLLWEAARQAGYEVSPEALAAVQVILAWVDISDGNRKIGGDPEGQ